jgi:catechol 2,3-dioxygenase-like lactoylglutathione lyase family enzyme
MSQAASSIKQQNSDVGVARVDMKFEVSLIPVSDVDRAKQFYTRLGWRLDDDIVNGNDFRVVQLTPPVPGPRSHSARDSHRQRLDRFVVG